MYGSYRECRSSGCVNYPMDAGQAEARTLRKTLAERPDNHSKTEENTRNGTWRQNKCKNVKKQEKKWAGSRFRIRAKAQKKRPLPALTENPAGEDVYKRQGKGWDVWLPRWNPRPSSWWQAIWACVADRTFSWFTTKSVTPRAWTIRWSTRCV